MPIVRSKGRGLLFNRQFLSFPSRNIYLLLATISITLSVIATIVLAENGNLTISTGLLQSPVFLTNATQIRITLTNAGDVNLTNITVEDRFLSNLFSLSGFSQQPTTNSSTLVRITGAGNTNLTPLAPNQSVVLLLNYSNLANDSLANHTINASATGVYNATTTFTLLSVTANSTTLSTPIAGDSFEPNNNATQAKNISLDGSPQVHTFGPAGDQDWIIFTARQGSTYDISVLNITPILNNSQSLTDGFLSLLNSSLSTIQSQDDSISSVELNPHIVWTASTSGTYFIRVTEASGSPAGPGGTYEIRVIERGRLGGVLFAASKTAMVSQDTFTANATVRCAQGRCLDVILTLDPEPSQPTKENSPLSTASISKTLEQEGIARVIVKTKISGLWKPRKPGIASTTDAYLARSSSVQNAIASTISTADFSLDKQLPAVGMMTGIVTKQGLEALLANPDVDEVFLDGPVHAFLNSSRPKIRADLLANISVSNQTIDGAGIGVCVIDTGVSYNHSDFGNCTISQFQNGQCQAVQSGFDFVNNDNDPIDDQGHGSHVAGTVASRDATFKGIAPRAEIIAIKALNSSGSGLLSNIIAGINWCITNKTRYNISVITMSLGDTSRSPGFCDRQNVFADPINKAVQAGILVSVASGNDGFGTSGNDGIASPACIENATSVGATLTANDVIASFTDRAQNLDLLAPGQTITSTQHNSATGHIPLQGTSMAAPHVSGAAALVYQLFALAYNRTPNPREVEQTLQTTGILVPDTSGTGLAFSRIDSLNAVKSKGAVPTTPGAKPFWTPSTNPVLCGTLLENQTCSANWTVNASSSPGTYEFFAIASQAFDINTTNKVNVTIQATAPSFTIQTLANPTSGNMGTRFNATVNTTNTGKSILVNATIVLTFNETDFQFNNATPAPTNTTINSATWINPFSNLQPNASLIINLSFGAKNRSTSVNSTIVVSGNASDATLSASAGSSTTIMINAFNVAPVITTNAPTTATVGVTYTYDANATDENNDTITFTLQAGPLGMSINTTTGLINWTPLANQTGLQNVTVNASDAKNASTIQSFTINTTTVNAAPTINSTPVTSATEDVLYQYTVTANDPENGTLIFSLPTAPTGMSINNATGAITWTPLNNQVGNNVVRVNVSDTSANQATQLFNITVTNSAPSFTSTALNSVIATTVYIYDVNSNDDGQGNITYAISSAPVGVTINTSTGLLTWIPAAFQIGSANISVVVDDGNSGVALQKFSLNITSPLLVNVSGPSSLNMSTEGIYQLIFINLGNATIANGSFKVTFNRSEINVIAPPTQASLENSTGLPFLPSDIINANLSLNASTLQTLGFPIDEIQATNYITLFPGGKVVFNFTGQAKNRSTSGNTTINSFSNGSSNATILFQNNSANITILFVNFPPSFNTTPPLTGTSTIPYSYDADALDGNGDNITFGLVLFPTGMSINQTTGVINFTPSLFQNGSFNVTINASDGRGGVGFQSFNLNITRLNRAPNITTSAPLNATEDATFTYDVNASDPENDTLVFLLDIFPSGMSINNATGLITWTPNNTQVGNATARVNVSDGLLGFANQTFNLTVLNNPPTITTTPPLSGVHGVLYSYDANSTDDRQGNITYAIVSAPTNMSVNISTGIVSWIPALNQIGLNTVQLRVLDGNGGIGEQNFTINISSAIQLQASATPTPASMNQIVTVRINATSIGQRTLFNLTLGVGFNATDLIFINATPGPSSNVTNGSAAFLNLSLNLTPGQTTVFSLNFLTQNRSSSSNTTISALFNASDNGTIAGQNTSQVIEISFSNFAPQITSSPVTTATLNTNYSYDVDATDGNGDALSFNLSAFPPGMTINTTSGLITWLANISGNQTVSVIVTDGRGGSAIQSYNLEVRTINRAPTITTIPILTATERVSYIYDVNATDADNDSVTFSLVTSPGGMTINSSTGVISFTAVNNQVGTATVSVRATDPFGSTDNQSFTILILNNAPNFTTTSALTVAERANFTYDANSTDDGFGTITYSLDLAPAGMNVNATSGVVTFTPATTQVGLTNTSLRVTDGNGGSGVQNFTLNVTDATPPNITITSPPNGTSFNRTNISVSFIASDNGGIVSCIALVNTTSTQLYSTSAAFNKTQSVTSNIILSQGTNSLNISCTDTSALTNSSSTILLFSDSIAPSITVTDPFNGKNISGNLSLNYSVIDATLDKVQIIVNAGSPTFVNATGNLTVLVNEGTGQNLTIIANDSVGLVSNITIRFNVDRTLPVALIGATPAVTIFSTRGAVANVTSVNSSDNLGIASTTFDFDAADGVTIADAIAQNASKNYTSPGGFIVTLSVTDVAGNIARTNTTVSIVRDSDADGFPDESATGLTTDTCPFVANATNNPAACTNDADGDSINDSTDTIVGSITQITGNLASPALVVGSTTNPTTATGFFTVSITSGGITLVTFDFNFTNTSRLILPNITIIRQTAGVLVSGLPSPINKSIILPKDNSNHNAVCVKDARAQSFAEITSGCTGALEIQVNCTGASQGKTCTDTGSGFRVSNLANTIVTSFTVTQSSSGSGGTGGGSAINGTLVQNGSAIITQQSSGSGGSFNVRGESESGRRQVSSSFTPAETTTVQLPTTRAPSEEGPTPESTLLLVETPTKKPSTETVPTRNDEEFFVAPADTGVANIGLIAAVIAIMALGLVAILIATVVWAWRK